MGGFSFDRCYHKHAPLLVGGDRVIYGGSCSSPSVLDADIYVGLCSTMKVLPDQRPWEKLPPLQILHHIDDMGVPKDAEEFRKLVTWVSDQLDAGKKIHVGCIGGHGRTGLFLSALVAVRKVSDDPIAYVRDNYCHRAVESAAQSKFLSTHYGCPDAAPKKGGFLSNAWSPKPQTWQKESADVDSGTPLMSPKSIWKPAVRLKY